MVDTEVERFVAEQKHKCEILLKEVTLHLHMLNSFTMSKVVKISLFSDFDNNTDDKYQLTKLHRNLVKTNAAVEINKVNDRIQISRCPPIFDGVLCWSHTEGPGTVTLPCPPGSIMGYTNLTNDKLRALAVVSKVCLPNGKWYQNSNGVSWSNYSLCAPSNTLYAIDSANKLKYPQDLEEDLLLNRWLPIIKMISQIGYATSFTTLIIAMVIFSLLRKLRNPRNRLHMHLFASFIMRAFMALLKDWIFVDGIGLAWDVVFVNGKNAFIKEYNTWICKVITSLWQYSIVANYSWILMEGLYLHNLILLALCADTTTITLYILLGWGLPGLIVVPWIVIRAIMENTLCWTTHENPSLFLVIRIPIMISILFNFVLFINIVRVLLVKLKTSVHLQRKKMQYKRWAKSTLVLVPLFGAHYTFFLGLSYHEDQHIELVWLFCDQLFASFQGAFVALLYCLLNSEVRAEVRRAWKAQLSKRYVDSFNSGHRELPKILRNKTNRERHRSEGDNGINSNSGTAMREFSVP